jgi:hypothetical protein
MDDRLSGLRQAVHETAIPFQRARAAYAEAINSEQISTPETMFSCKF